MSSSDDDVNYLWGPTGPIMEFDESNDSRTFIFDPQGSCLATSNARIQNPQIYDAYGMSTMVYSGDARSVQQPFQYKGQAGCLTDGFSGLVYCLHRYYDPPSGRWTSRDPIGLDGGMNVYGYCGGDPITGCDPSGLDTVTCDDVLNGLANLFGGMGNMLTFGATGTISQYNCRALGYDEFDYHGGLFVGGQGLGFGLSLFTGGAELRVLGIAGKAGFGIAEAAARLGAKVAPRLAERVATRILKGCVKKAAAEAVLTRIQAAAAAQLHAAYKGERIDTIAKMYAGRSTILTGFDVTITPRFQRGPDFLMAGRNIWWDITTEAQWAAHLDRYKDFGFGKFLGY